MDSQADSAERFYYHLLDDYEGWRRFTIPFAFFQRRADWQPGGAPDDGFNLNAVWGYAFGFPGWRRQPDRLSRRAHGCRRGRPDSAANRRR